MWFDIIKTNIDALLDDLQNIEGLEVPELIEEIERIKDTSEASENISQPLLIDDTVRRDTPPAPSLDREIPPLIDLLEPIVEDREITPEETQQVENSKWWLALQRRYPNLHGFATKPKQSRIRQV